MRRSPPFLLSLSLGTARGRENRAPMTDTGAGADQEAVIDLSHDSEDGSQQGGGAAEAIEISDEESELANEANEANEAASEALPPPMVPIHVPASDLNPYPLRIQQSEIGQPGLFTPDGIPANTFVCAYVHDRVISNVELNRLSPEERKPLSRYAVAGPSPGETLLVKLPIDDVQRRVAAFANEPRFGKTANMTLYAERVSVEEGTFYFVGLYTCNADVPANTELTWNYGKDYEQVREAEAYRAGDACADALHPDDTDLIEDRQQRVHTILKARPGNLDGVLIRIEDASSAETSDESYSGNVSDQEPRDASKRLKAKGEEWVQE